MRHGCFCAHPYLLRLLDLNPEQIADYQHAVRRGDRRNIPGAVRASAGLSTTAADVDRFLDALARIAGGEAAPVAVRPGRAHRRLLAAHDRRRAWSSAGRRLGAVVRPRLSRSPPCSSASTSSRACRCSATSIGDESTGRAVVVDPQRDVSGYLDDAAGHGLRIERVIETHFHADFLSGHLELADATGAVISYGDAASAEFPIEPLAARPARSSSATSSSRSATPPVTPRSRSRSSCGSTPTTPSRGACSPATRCSSATSAAPTCSTVGRLDAPTTSPASCTARCTSSS